MGVRRQLGAKSNLPRDIRPCSQKIAPSKESLSFSQHFPTVEEARVCNPIIIGHKSKHEVPPPNQTQTPISDRITIPQTKTSKNECNRKTKHFRDN
jgi:hypothetical protein